MTTEKKKSGCAGIAIKVFLGIIGLSILSTFFTSSDSATPEPPVTRPTPPKPQAAPAPAPAEVAAKPQPDPTAKLIDEAYYAGRRFIQNSLKAPSTAKFSNIRTDAQTGASKLATGRFKGWGTVEAQNNFGVPLKEDWVTELQLEGESWRVVYARLGTNVILDNRETRKTAEIKGAERFIGMSRDAMLKEFGNPIEIEKGGHPSDGKFTIYVYSKEKGKETYFTIWDSDGKIDNGMYQGTPFFKK